MVKKAICLMSLILAMTIAAPVLPDTILQFGFEGTVGEDLPAMNDDTGIWGPFTHHEGANPGATIKYDGDTAADSPGSTSAKFTTDGTATGNSDTFLLLAGTQDIDLGSYTAGLTVEALIKANSTGTGYRCVFSEEIMFKMYLSADMLCVDRKWGPGKWNENFTQITADFTGLYDQWHHVAAVWSSIPDGNGKRLKLYIDGEEVAGIEGNPDPTQNAIPASGFAVGGYMRSSGTSYQYWDGYIDDFRLSDVALDPSEFLIAASETARRPRPTDGARNVPTDVVLNWAPGIAAASHNVYFGNSFDDVNQAADASPEFKGNQPLDANSYSPPGDLELGLTYYWRIDEVNDANADSPWKGAVWSFTVGGKAYNPDPEDGGENVPIMGAVLTWATGLQASSHDVYFSSGFDDVNDADNSLPVGTSAYKGNQPIDANSYEPGLLDFGATYYWRIDEVSAEKTIRGDVWSFTVADYLLVEDFESYESSTDLEAVWQGFGSAEGGYVNLSVEPPGRAHGGQQSMEVEYWNLLGFTYADAARTFDDPQDWTAVGIKSLELSFAGITGNEPDQLYLILEDDTGNSATVNHDDPNSVLNTDWQQWAVDLGIFADAGVDLTAVKKVFIGVGDRNGSADGGKGFLYVDDIRLYPPRCLSDYAPTGDMNGDCTVDFEDFDAMANDWLESSYTLEGVAPNNNRLMLWYTFDVSADGNAPDSSGNGHLGILDPPPGVWDPNGYKDGCLVFDDDTAVIAPNDIFTGTETSLTISAWVSGGIGTVGRDNTILEIGTENDMFLRIDVPDDNGDVYWKVGDSLVWGDVETAEWLDLWNHYAFVKDAMDLGDPNDDVLRIYCNGRLVAEEVAGEPLAAHLVGADFKVGSQITHSNDFIGRIDDLRVYDYALSQGEIVGTAVEGNSLFVPLRSDANLNDDDEINFQDLAVMVDNWLIEQLWP